MSAINQLAKTLTQEIAEVAHQRSKLIVWEDLNNERKLVLPRNNDGFGCDANWVDDMYYILRARYSGEKLGYHRNFKGTIFELEKLLREGWFYTGQEDSYGQTRGTKGDDLPVECFLHCISNHDLVGNRLLGDRLHSAMSIGEYRAMSALLLLSPFSPLLFMGQEWMASSPFYFFTFHADFSANIREGRRRYLAKSTPTPDLGKMKDPQSIGAFEDSKISWSEIEGEAQRGVLSLYRDCIRLRSRELTERTRGHWSVASVGENAISIRYDIHARHSLVIVTSLTNCRVCTSVGEVNLKPTSRIRD